MPRPRKGTKYTLLWRTYSTRTKEPPPGTESFEEHHFVNLDARDEIESEVAAILDDAGASFVDGSMRLVVGPVEEVRFKRETVTTLQIGEPKPRTRKPRAVKAMKLPPAKTVEAQAK